MHGMGRSSNPGKCSAPKPSTPSRPLEMLISPGFVPREVVPLHPFPGTAEGTALPPSPWPELPRCGRRPGHSLPDASSQTRRTAATPGPASGQRAPPWAGELTELANFVSFCWKEEKKSRESENEHAARQRRRKDVFNVRPIMQPSFPARSCLKTA